MGSVFESLVFEPPLCLTNRDYGHLLRLLLSNLNYNKLFSFQIAMFIFTISLSLWVSSIAIYHDATWVLMAIGITALLCLGLTLFSFQTRWDFTGN